jgi:type IV secretion system protein VirD4
MSWVVTLFILCGILYSIFQDSDEPEKIRRDLGLPSEQKVSRFDWAEIWLGLFMVAFLIVAFGIYTSKGMEQFIWILAGGSVLGFLALKVNTARARQTVQFRVQQTQAQKGTIFGQASFTTNKSLSQDKMVGNNPSKPSGIPIGFSIPEDESPPIFIQYNDNRALFTAAPNRSGKLTTAIAPTLLSYDAPIFIIDPKGEAAAISARYRRDHMGHRVFVVNPFNTLKAHFEKIGFTSARFNPLAALDPKNERYVSDVATLAEAIILKDGDKQFFTDSARNLVEGVILWLVEHGKPELKNLPTMRDIISLEKSALDIWLEPAIKESAPYISNKLAQFLGDNQSVLEVLSTARSQTKFLDDPLLRESLCGDDFRFIDLKREKISVYLVLPANLLVSQARWFRLLVGSALDVLTSTEEKNYKPVLMMLDEFPALGHLSSIENALGLTSGFGVQLWPFVQDIHQMQGLYGQRWKSFLANAGIQQYFTPNDMETAEFISKRAGTRTAEVSNVNYGGYSIDSVEKGNYGIHETFSEISRPLIPPHDLFDMPSDMGLLFYHGRANPTRYVRTPYYQSLYYQGRYDLNPYHAS